MTFSIWVEIRLYCQSLFLGAGSVLPCTCKYRVSRAAENHSRLLLNVCNFLLSEKQLTLISFLSFKDFQLNSHLSTLANIHKIYHTLNKLVSESLKTVASFEAALLCKCV